MTGGITSGISPEAELIASNIDLLTEILVRLPAKSLLRFKCVSKHWFCLISHSQFRSNHSIQNPSPSISGLYFYFYSQLDSVSLRGHRNLPSLSFLDGFGEQSRIRVIHSCNGLLLCHNGLYEDHIHRHRLIVCNPTTKEHTILPNWQKSSYTGDAYLAFDPSKSRHYKVIYFSYVSLFPPSSIDIYWSQSACWKQVTVQQIHWARGVFWNGAIHWFNCDDSLLRFDINAEEMIVMPNPQEPKILTRNKTKYFGESRGSLILIQSKLRSPLGFRILELDKDYRGWIVKCRVNLRPLIAAFPEMKGKLFWVLKVLPIAKEENERDFTLVLTIPGRIVSYDPKCKTWDVLCDLLVGKLYVYDFNHVYPFIETLSPV